MKIRTDRHFSKFLTMVMLVASFGAIASPQAQAAGYWQYEYYYDHFTSYQKCVNFGNSSVLYWPGTDGYRCYPTAGSPRWSMDIHWTYDADSGFGGNSSGGAFR